MPFSSAANALSEKLLKEYVLRRKQQQFLHLFGTVDYDLAYDYKKQRARR